MTLKRTLLGLVCAAFVVGLATAAAAQTASPGPTSSSRMEGTGEPNCLNFTSQAEAQAFFESNGGPANDPYQLDTDHNGRACDGASSASIVVADTNPVLAQAASPSPTVSPTATPVATGTPTPAALATATPTVGAGLPRTGAPVHAYAITGFVLTLAGAGLLIVNRTRRPAAVAHWDEYTLIGW